MAIIDVSRYGEMNKEFGDHLYRTWGPTLMCFPSDTDASRSLMATSFQKQMLVLLNPDVPHVLGGFENIFGKYNRAYKKLPGEWEIVHRIDKFGDAGVYTLVVFDRATKTYDMIEKVVAEIRTEKFGYLHNSEVMDNLKPGDVVTDSVLYKSTSYDDNMNYRIGKNALTMYSTSNPTIEDAIQVRRGWAESVQFVELDDVVVGLNDNDIMTNRYGDDHNYVPFPMIGEQVVNNVICSTRRIVKDHLLFDFQSKNLRQSYPTDTKYYTSKNARVYDINVYYNGDDEFPDNLFNSHLKKIYECCCQYADEITAWGNWIKHECKEDPRKKYTRNVTYMIHRNKFVSDQTHKWKFKDREFANVLISFKTSAVVSLEAGFKLTGRYGDKGVISKIANDSCAEDTGETNYIENFISSLNEGMGGAELTPEEMIAMGKSFSVVPDSEMPYMEDGTKVDILLNASGAIRRLNNGQLVEVDLAFQMEEIRKEICRQESLDAKYELLFKFLELVNVDEYKFFYNKYTAWDKRVTIDGETIRFFNSKMAYEFMHDVETHGIYLVKPPDSCIRYDTVKSVYDAFPFIQPQQLYIDKFGIARKKIMRKCIVGMKYVYVLKQTSNKNFSARSMGRVNKKGLPEKSTDKRDNRSEISHNPLKLGEVHNLMSSVSGREMAEHNIFTRSSPVGRKSLIRILQAAGDPAAIHKLKIKDSYRNVNADIFNAYIKAWGIKVNFLTSIDNIEDAIIDATQLYTVYGYTILDIPSRRGLYMRCFDAFHQYKTSVIVVATDPNSFIWDKVFEAEELGDIPDDMKTVCKNATAGLYANKVNSGLKDEEDDD